MGPMWKFEEYNAERDSWISRGLMVDLPIDARVTPLVRAAADQMGVEVDGLMGIREDDQTVGLLRGGRLVGRLRAQLGEALSRRDSRQMDEVFQRDYECRPPRVELPATCSICGLPTDPPCIHLACPVVPPPERRDNSPAQCLAAVKMPMPLTRLSFDFDAGAVAVVQDEVDGGGLTPDGDDTARPEFRNAIPLRHTFDGPRELLPGSVKVESPTDCDACQYGFGCEERAMQPTNCLDFKPMGWVVRKTRQPG